MLSFLTIFKLFRLLVGWARMQPIRQGEIFDICLKFQIGLFERFLGADRSFYY